MLDRQLDLFANDALMASAGIESDIDATSIGIGPQRDPVVTTSNVVPSMQGEAAHAAENTAKIAAESNMPQAKKPDKRTKAQFEPRAWLLKITTPPAREDRPENLAGCLDWLSKQVRVEASIVGQIRGAVRTIAKVARIGADKLPADPVKLRPILKSAMPASLRLTQNHWMNCLSHLRTLLAATGWTIEYVYDQRIVGDEWARLLPKAAEEEIQPERFPLLPFARYCEVNGVAPAQVDATTIENFEKWLETNTLNLNPRPTATSVARRWRRNQKAIPGWPQTPVELVSRVPQKFRDLENFPPGFQSDLHNYLESLRNPDPFDPHLGRPAAELTVQHARRAILRAATILIEEGTPIGEIKLIADIVQPTQLRKILERLFEDGKELIARAESTSRWSHTAMIIANNLRTAAKRHVRPEPAVLKEITELCSVVKVSRRGLSMKTHRRLAQFATKDEHDRLHGLPEFAFERAERLWTEAKDAKDERKARNFAQSAKLHEAALALAILCVNPMRRENLASLELDRHFLRDHRGRIVHLLIPATEVKNRRIIDAKIEKALAKRIDRHLKTFRPFIRDHEKSTALFPGPDGKPRVPNTLARKVTRLVESQLGADFTVHLMRHLFVETVLKDNPNNIGLAQRGLGHTRQKTTEEMYGARSTGAALAIHAKILEERGKPGKVKSGVGERRLRYG